MLPDGQLPEQRRARIPVKFNMKPSLCRLTGQGQSTFGTTAKIELLSAFGNFEAARLT
jgi:hypothetical protein